MVRRDGVARLVSHGGETLSSAYPELVGEPLDLGPEIELTEWTRDGKLRHPRYLALRHDKPACEVVREEPAG